MHCRCRKCGSRRTLTRHPDHYLRAPRCLRCKARDWRVDRYRSKHERGPQVRCYPGRGGCNSYAFPHRRGSGYCVHNQRMTPEDHRIREEGH